MKQIPHISRLVNRQGSTLPFQDPFDDDLDQVFGSDNNKHSSSTVTTAMLNHHRPAPPPNPLPRFTSSITMMDPLFDDDPDNSCCCLNDVGDNMSVSLENTKDTDANYYYSNTNTNNIDTA